MGLGVIDQGSGFSAAKYFARKGAKVIVTDYTKQSELNPKTIAQLKKYKNVQLVLGKHREQDFKNRDLIIRNPGVHWDSKYLKIARSNNIPVKTDLGIFFDEIQDKGIQVIGITGTRGKTTTAYLVYEILRANRARLLPSRKREVYIGGNVGNSPLNFVDKLKKNDLVVLEVSSFLLHELSNGHFNVACFTNLLEDHMNFYKSMTCYKKDKVNIFKNQTADDFVVLNRLDPRVKSLGNRTRAKVKYFGKENIKDLKIIGQHNQANMAAAFEICKIFKVPKTVMIKVAKNFKGVPNRLELVREYKGRKFYNDTTATSPDAAIAALNAFNKKVILISGGNTKELSLKRLTDLMKKKVKTLILLPGNANKDLPKGENVKTMDQAVALAWENSKEGDVILLSPGLTWLPVMNEFKRGEEFVKFVKKLK